MFSFPRRLALGVGVCIALAGCGEKGPIVIGAVGDLQTGGKGLGSGFRNGVALAEEDVNERGGVKGSLVSVVFADDQGDPGFVPKVDEKLISGGALALVGHNTSVTTAAALPVVNRHKIPLIGPEATSSQFSGKDDFYIRVEVAEVWMAEILATYAVQKMGLHSFGVMLDEKNRPFSRPYFEAFRKRAASLGAECELLYPYTILDTTEAGRQAEGFLARRGQAVLLIADGMDTRLLAQVARKVRADVPLLGSPWVVPPRVAEDLPAAPEGLIFPCTWNPDSQAPAYLEFRERYEKRFAMAVDYHAVHSYEAVMLLVRGMEVAGRDRDRLRKTVANISKFEGLQGPVEIDVYGDCRREVFLLQFRNGVPRYAAKPG